MYPYNHENNLNLHLPSPYRQAPLYQNWQNQPRIIPTYNPIQMQERATNAVNIVRTIDGIDSQKQINFQNLQHHYGQQPTVQAIVYNNMGATHTHPISQNMTNFNLQPYQTSYPYISHVINYQNPSIIHNNNNLSYAKPYVGNILQYSNSNQQSPIQNLIDQKNQINQEEKNQVFLQPFYGQQQNQNLSFIKNSFNFQNTFPQSQYSSNTNLQLYQSAEPQINEAMPIQFNDMNLQKFLKIKENQQNYTQDNKNIPQFYDQQQKKQLISNQNKLYYKQIELIKKQIQLNCEPLNQDMVYLIKANQRKLIGFSIRSSRFRGVSKNGKKWQVQLLGNHQKRYIGSITSEEQAARIYDAFAIIKNGLRAKTNFSYKKSDVDKIIAIFEEESYHEIDLQKANNEIIKRVLQQAL